ncbi:hypothetical protein OH799_02555 [Nocardia sp. NBC_00881]|uniref:hypothetical protein n=1 Tax=Nocardia sp. NBC_00881 TaxID=2975995 RepID=UPI00386C4CF4|nr:hypothetical protein OH799_02555 [Nocardia sp. NBC_00881]
MTTGSRLVAEQWRGGAAVIPEKTNRVDPDTMQRLSTAGDAFGTQLCVVHGEPDDSRLPAVC